MSLKYEKQKKIKEVINKEKMKYIIETLQIKEDTNMTRIYSAISKLENKNPENKKDEQP